MHEAAIQGIPVVRKQRGYRWSDDGVTLDILAPSLPVLADTGDDINENSIVAMLHYDNFSELFMGDAGESSEARLLASDADLHVDVVDVLKVGHHGSRYASTPAFIAAVRPSIAIISVGRHNTFGHPALSTLETLGARSASMFRRDRCEALVLSPPGKVKSIVPCASQAGSSTRTLSVSPPPAATGTHKPLTATKQSGGPASPALLNAHVTAATPVSVVEITSPKNPNDGKQRWLSLSVVSVTNSRVAVDLQAVAW